jgi:hypothetical protein
LADVIFRVFLADKLLVSDFEEVSNRTSAPRLLSDY